jgi:hypothetical protein
MGAQLRPSGVRSKAARCGPLLLRGVLETQLGWEVVAKAVDGKAAATTPDVARGRQQITAVAACADAGANDSVFAS